MITRHVVIVILKLIMHDEIGLRLPSKLSYFEKHLIKNNYHIAQTVSTSFGDCM